MALPLSDPRDAFEPLPLRRKARLAAEILVIYANARWTVARHEIPATLEHLRRRPGQPQPLDDPSAYRTGLRLGAAVGRILSRLPTDSRCLARSLVLTALLARRGIPSSLMIGVRAGGDFGAHAWVEYGGLPLLRDEQSTYHRLVEFHADGSLNGHDSTMDVPAEASKSAATGEDVAATS
jgi:transglutaminase superfamily protein